MHGLLLNFLVAIILTTLFTSAHSQQPVKFIPVYVEPYYNAGKTPTEKPRVAVSGQFNERLTSTDRIAIEQVTQDMQSQASRMTPMTLMVLAIRNYDVGLRDAAVFWFYVAKDRYATLAGVIDMNNPAVSQVTQATRDFANLAGPTINGYAFCDLKKQAAIRQEAIKWVEANTYEALFVDQLPGKPGDRRENLKTALAKIKSDAAKEAEYLAQPDNIEKIKESRKKNRADEQFCW